MPADSLWLSSVLKIWYARACQLVRRPQRALRLAGRFFSIYLDGLGHDLVSRVLVTTVLGSSEERVASAAAATATYLGTAVVSGKDDNVVGSHDSGDGCDDNKDAGGREGKRNE